MSYRFYEAEAGDGRGYGDMYKIIQCPGGRTRIRGTGMTIAVACRAHRNNVKFGVGMFRSPGAGCTWGVIIGPDFRFAFASK